MYLYNAIFLTLGKVTLAYSLTVILALVLVLLNYVLPYRAQTEQITYGRRQLTSQNMGAVPLQPYSIDKHLLAWK